MAIKVEVTDRSACQKDLVIEASEDVVQQAFNAAYQELSRYARVPGFRPGKVPSSVIKQRYRREAREAVRNQLLPRLLNQALKEHDLQLVSDPKVNELLLEEGRPLTLKTAIEVYPKIEGGAFKGLRVRKDVKPVTDEDVNRVIERLREQLVELIPVEDRAADIGDVATVRLSAQVVTSTDPKGAEQLALQDQMVDIELGGTDILPEFTENLKGMNVGETRVFHVAYPREYHEAELAGKDIKYTATLEALRIKQWPELDDEFVQTIGEDFETLAEYREEVRRRLQQAAEAEADEEVRQTLLQQLVDQHPFEVPSTLVEQRLERRLNNLIRAVAQQGIDPRSAELDWKAIVAGERENAVRDVRATLLLQTIAEQEGIQVTDTEVDGEISRLAASLRQSPIQLKSRLTKEGSLDTIKSEIRNRKALDVVVKTAEVE
jgi:trigger factor